MSFRTISRRDFLTAAGAGAAAWWSLGATGCATDPARFGDASPSPDAAAATATDLARGDLLTPTCGQLTEPNIEGPFFKPGSPERTSLRQPGGTPLRLTGRVLGQDCRPLAGALLDFWQANDAGAYDTTGFGYRGHQFTAADGSYTLDTIVPGRYLNGPTYRPAHIHVKAGAAGTMVLTTQLYFAGDPFNAGDPFILPSLIMAPLTDGPGGVKEAHFDFVLARAPTDLG